ncbi:MAG: mechanosensitive ion channel family protein [Rhodospirillaceae bacterium]
MDVPPILQDLLGNQTVSTLVLLVAALAVRFALDRYLRAKPNLDVEHRRRIVSNVKNGLFVLVVIGLAFVWAPALHSFAISLAAFAVAIIIASKEVILCLSGTLVKFTTGSFRVGDWIEVGGQRGEVIDQDLMSTTLQELGHGATAYEFTGKTVLLPNSVFLSSPVKNERFHKRYVIHEFTVTVEAHVDLEPVIAAAVAVIRAETADGETVARRYRALIESRASIKLPALEPTTRLATTNEGRVRIAFICFLPTAAAAAIERKAVAAALAEIRKSATATSPVPAG